MRPEIVSWLATAMPEGTDTPCGHHLAVEGRACGQTPTRAYIPGRRCYDHALDQGSQERTHT